MKRGWEMTFTKYSKTKLINSSFIESSNVYISYEEMLESSLPINAMIIVLICREWWDDRRVSLMIQVKRHDNKVENEV